MTVEVLRWRATAGWLETKDDIRRANHLAARLGGMVTQIPALRLARNAWLALMICASAGWMRPQYEVPSGVGSICRT